MSPFMRRAVPEISVHELDEPTRPARGARVR